MAKIWIPAGKIPTKERDFRSVISDARHAVFSVHRFRPNGKGGNDVTALGSGFFVSSSVFVTCAHVIDPKAIPHQAGDTYRLVNNIDGQFGIIHEVNGGLGKDVHIFADDDLAILQSTTKKDQAYLPVSYADVPVGLELGVAGYPLAQLVTDANGHITPAGIVYRIARGVANAFYATDINSDHYPVKNINVVEVNFMFVPGNSGGPIFDGRTGRVIAYVKGFQHYKIKEVEERCSLMALPAGLQPNYLDSVYAVYSLGITLGRVRSHLEKFGVTL